MIKRFCNPYLRRELYDSVLPNIYVLGVCGISDYFALRWDEPYNELCGINQLKFFNCHSIFQAGRTAKIPGIPVRL